MHTWSWLSNGERILEFIGTFVFAISGALMAIRKRFDAVGVLLLAEITALGGGILRDLVIGRNPPAAFSDSAYLIIPLVAAVVTFFAHPVVDRLKVAVLIFDAAGLSLFCVTGTLVSLDHGLGALQAVVLGVASGVGGGVLRDIIAMEVPVVVRADSDLYSIPAALGASAVVILHGTWLPQTAVSVGAALLVFVFRMLVMRFGWRAPVARMTLH